MRIGSWPRLNCETKPRLTRNLEFISDSCAVPGGDSRSSPPSTSAASDQLEHFDSFVAHVRHIDGVPRINPDATRAVELPAIFAK